MVIWSFDQPNQWLLEPYGEKSKHCKVYVLSHVEDTVWLNARVYNRCTTDEGCVRRYWLISSFYGVDEGFNSTMDFNVVPNPNEGRMTLVFEHLTGIVNVKVYDLTGNLIDVIQDMDSNRIDYSIKGEACGIYFFVATSKEGTISKKVIVR